MTGVVARFDDRELAELVRRLATVGGLTPALKNIGEYGVQSTQRRFEIETAPDGSRWAPLDPRYAAVKRGAGILREAGFAGGLAGSIAYRAEGGSVSWGTNKVHAALHQFGATIVPKGARALAFSIGGASVFAMKATIPARPYIGISDEDRAEIRGILQDFLGEALSRSHPEI